MNFNLLIIISCVNINSSYSPFLFLITFLDLKIIRPIFKNVCSQYLTPILFILQVERLPVNDRQRHPLLLYFFSHFSYLLFLCRIECCYTLNKCKKAVEKVIYRLSTYDVKKNVHRWEPLYRTPGGASGGTVGFRRIHGRALVRNQGEKSLALLRLEGKTYT